MNELVFNCIKLEETLLKNGFSRNKLLCDKTELLELILPIDKHADQEYLDAFYINYRNMLYAYLNDEVCKMIRREYKDTYFKRNKKDWRD